ncbi:MAG: ammonia-forming cytochrome c nitrite reductase subunit c552, partial [Candidatus Aminicenantes bacterium]|nr:ammonia-forming cytochrome c nitrite reductase subunit c552 [Candidatus Aminicenantes bacterium]
LATVGILLLRENIARRKAEARQTAYPVAALDELTDDPAVWGRNFPRQYESYRRTTDMERTRHGGSEADPFAVGQDGVPKTTSRIEQDPRLKTLWDGYAFAIDYREERGHAFMLHDQRETERVLQRPQVGSCLHCHASTVLAYRRAGIEAGAPGALSDPLLGPAGMEQLRKGFVLVSAEPYAEAVRRVANPVSCLDCHDPQSMNLRVTRPGLLDGLAALAAGDDSVPHLPSIEKWRQGDRGKPYDPNDAASPQEMRSLTCAQCHVEYYCGPKAVLFFPWGKGLKAERIEAAYDAYRFPDGSPFSDWTHARTGAKVVKLQHPEFELWSQGPHARAGVACADCHMPYQREGAVKASSHHVRSPLLHINRSCQVCHKASEEELRERAFLVQDRTKALMDRALDAVVELIAAIEEAQKNGAGESLLREPRLLQRKSQFRVDFVNSENSMGFHAPQEAARLLGEAIDYAHRGRLALMKAPAGRSGVNDKN